MKGRGAPRGAGRELAQHNHGPCRTYPLRPPLPALARFRIIDKDYAEGRHAFMEKRKPQFQGR